MPNFCLKREKGLDDQQDDSDFKCRQCQKDLGQVSAYLNTADSFESIISILRGIISHKNSAKLHQLTLTNAVFQPQEFPFTSGVIAQRRRY